MRRPITLVLCLLALSAGLSSVATSATAADTSTVLATGRFAHLLVDEAAQRIFVTRAGSSTSILVTDLAGGSALDLLGPSTALLHGANGLAISSDGSDVFATLYDAASSTGAVAEIDANTLDVQKVSLGFGNCPTSVAVAHSLVFVGYTSGNTNGSCATSNGDIASIDFSQPSPTPSMGLRGALPLSGRVLLSGAGDELAAAVQSSSAVIGVYDASTGTPALTTSPTPVSGCTSVRDMQLTHDGTDVLVSCSTPAAVLSLNASTLTEDASYAGLTGEHAAAGITSADAGAVAAGFEAASQKDVFVYTRGGTFVRSYGFGTDALAVDGLQFGAAGTLYAVTHNSGSTTWRLHVLHDATRFAVQLTALMSAAHSPPALHDPITVSGKLLSAASPLSGGETVHLVRKDLAGIHDVADATTDGTGSFSFAPDTPNDGTEDIGGPVTYTASWPGDATHRPGVVSVSANIPRWPTSLTVRTNRTTYAHGGLATVTAHLGQTLNSRKVAIYMTPYGGSKVLLKNADVDANGNLRVSHRVYKRTTFSARFVGDFLYAPAHASTVAQVHGLVTEALAGSYGTSGAYHLYHLTSNPVLRARLYPNLDDVCLYFRAQRYSSGAWHTVATSSCVRTNSLGKAAGALTGNHLTGNPYRLRAEWRGNSIALAFNGPWLRLKFTA